MNKKLINVLKTLLTSAAALIAGFMAIAFPFRLFDNLSAEGMRYLFIGEMALYFTLGMIFLFIKGKREEEKEKENARRKTRRIKFEQAQKDYYDFAA